MRDDSGYGAGSIFLSFLLGGVVGASLALLLAPESGRETRKKIRELAEDVQDKVKNYAGEVKEKVTSTVEKGKGFVEEKKSIITTAIEAGRDAYDKEKERLSKQDNA
jgi:gas vesicle protein